MKQMRCQGETIRAFPDALPMLTNRSTQQLCPRCGEWSALEHFRSLSGQCYTCRKTRVMQRQRAQRVQRRSAARCTRCGGERDSTCHVWCQVCRQRQQHYQARRQQGGTC